MNAEPKPKRTSAERMRDHRARMQARGMKPVTIWTFNTSDPEFRRIIERDIREARTSREDREELGFIYGHFLLHMSELDAEERES